MNKHEVMESFTPIWWTYITIVFLAIVALLALPKYSKWANHKIYRKALSIMLVSNLVIENCYGLYIGSWNIQENLPLHLCGMSSIMSIILLFNYHRPTAQVFYYWGLTGGFYSILTPEFDLGTQGFFFYAYFISHGGLILASLYMIIYDGFVPEKKSWLKSFVVIQFAAAGVGIFNWITQSNYMYLASPPIANNPLIMGDWPWYILTFEVLALGHFLFLYLIFDFTVLINKKELLIWRRN
jgi:hypothetical integral membrane protein (TIGR02206 family)